MRPRRGTELNSKGTFWVLVVFGSLCLIVNLVRLPFVSGAFSAGSCVALAILGATAVWRGGYMLEWWGRPERQ